MSDRDLGCKKAAAVPRGSMTAKRFSRFRVLGNSSLRGGTYDHFSHVNISRLLDCESFPPAFSGGNAWEQVEREQTLRALRETNWVVGGARGAAARLGLKRTSLAYKMDRLGISRPPQ